MPRAQQANLTTTGLCMHTRLQCCSPHSVPTRLGLLNWGKTHTTLMKPGHCAHQKIHTGYNTLKRPCLKHPCLQ